MAVLIYDPLQNDRKTYAVRNQLSDKFGGLCSNSQDSSRYTLQVVNDLEARSAGKLGTKISSVKADYHARLRHTFEIVSYVPLPSIS